MLVGVAEYSAGALMSILHGRAARLRAAVVLSGAATLFIFAGWLYRDGFPLLHPIPLSATIAGGVWLWRGLSRRGTPGGQ